MCVFLLSFFLWVALIFGACVACGYRVSGVAVTLIKARELARRLTHAYSLIYELKSHEIHGLGMPSSMKNPNPHQIQRIAKGNTSCIRSK